MSSDRIRPVEPDQKFTAKQHLQAFCASLSKNGGAILRQWKDDDHVFAIASTFATFVAQIESEVLSKQEDQQEYALSVLVKRLRDRLEGRYIPDHLAADMEIADVVTWATATVFRDLEAISSQLILDRLRK